LKTLLEDESFLNYCRNGNKADVAKWENWLQEHPQYRSEVEEQKRLIQAMAYRTAEVKVEQNYLRLKERIERRNTDTPRMPFRLSLWMKIAASLVLVGSAVYLTNQRKFTSAADDFVQQDTTLAPGDRALLTLADGSTISLGEVPVGTLALQGGLRVEKIATGDIIYHVDETDKSMQGAYNSIATPTGGQYTVTLPDGSKAWLNASSSLRYPVQFKANERRVEMTGEVYFEIAKLARTTTNGKKRVPFFVKTDKQEIQVLGTHFNVNAYADEPGVITTLVEGSVRVTATLDGKSTLLHPGQQSILDRGIVVRQADIEQQIAWTKGDFIFRNEELGGILRQISRWYGVEIECPTHLEKLRFDGIVSRKQPLNTIIDMIQTTGKVKMKRIERRIVVTD